MQRELQPLTLPRVPADPPRSVLFIYVAWVTTPEAFDDFKASLLQNALSNVEDAESVSFLVCCMQDEVAEWVVSTFPDHLANGFVKLYMLDSLVKRTGVA